MYVARWTLVDYGKGTMKWINLAIMTAILISILCIYSITNTAVGHHIATTLMPKETASNCVIEKIYTPDKEILVETKMICSDGNVGPSYWELFAEFYYQGVSVPEYCRYVEGKFGLPKKVCLNKDGSWRQ